MSKVLKELAIVQRAKDNFPVDDLAAAQNWRCHFKNKQ
jgi:hypothetical protein